MRRGDCVRAHRGCIRTVVRRIDRYLFLCAYLALLLYQALLSSLVWFLLDKKTDAISVWESDGPSRQILSQNDLGHRILKSDFIPSDFATSDIGLHKGQY